MKKSLTQYKRYMITDVTSIRQFNAHIEYLTISINKAISDIPQLYKQIQHYKERLPQWQKELEKQKKSLKLHIKFLLQSKNKFTLAAKIDKLKKQLRNLDI